MKQKIQSELDVEGFLVVLKGTLISIPFNVIGASILSLDFLYHRVSRRVVFAWLGSIFFLTLVRFIFNQIIIAKKYYQTHFDVTLFLFLVFIFLTGLTWGASFFIFFPIINSTQQTILALVLGGMSAGGVAVLAIYLTSFYAYVVPMFVPIIIYDFYSLQPDKVITGILYSIFLLMICMTAIVTSRLLHTTLKLNREKDLLIKELKVFNLKLEKSIGEARAMSITDSLTGLYNRRYFDMIFDNELKKAQRNQYSMNLVFIDVDNFKYINDTFGHPCGDDFLIYVANSLKRSAKRANDIIFRLGGDEFALVISNMLPTEVMLFCNALQSRFSNDNHYKNVTLSMGIISISSFQSLDLQTVITAADRTLYQAKKNGKNKVIATVID